jgi:UDP-N-acetylmuramate: L-alanyl-gamma-D-glutamyl-meso-diaminopimelate ligase
MQTQNFKKFPNFNDLKKIHIIGVCGTLMGSFASYLKRTGIDVTGSDQNVYPPMSDVLKNAGVTIFNGYAVENLTSMSVKPDLVVIGNVIGASNPEAKAAIEGGYAYTSLPEAMEKILLPKTRNLVVAGTHGKTTTSSMLSHVLVACEKDPSYFIGGVSADLPNSFHLGKNAEGSYFVLEGDEYDTAFWDKVPKFNHYLPDDAILTSVEYDHADIYPDFEAVKKAFLGLLTRIRPGGRLIACADYPVIGDLIQASGFDRSRVSFYGSREGSGVTYWPADIRTEEGKTHFKVLENGKSVAELTIQLPGLHNVVNALAVWIECKNLGVHADAVKRGLASFRGVKRRQEERGEVRGVLVLDDFAHHPTAVRETLRALKLKYPKRRMVAVFEPRSATSRRKVFQKEYGTAFLEADAVFIASPYDQTKIASDDQFSSRDLVQDLVSHGKRAQLMETVEAGISQVAHFAEKGDLVAVLSNGGFGGFIPKLLDALKAD